MRVTGFAEYQPGRVRRPARVTIRAGGAADVAAIAAIQLRADRSAHPEAYRRAVDDPDRCLLVAEADSPGGGPVVVGWGQTSHRTMVTDPAPAGHYLGGVTVDPAWRRRGVGTALTGARLAWIARRAHEAYFVVNPANRASIALHRRWSFEEVARGPRLAGVTFDGGTGLLLRATWPDSGPG